VALLLHSYIHPPTVLNRRDKEQGTCRTLFFIPSLFYRLEFFTKLLCVDYVVNVYWKSKCKLHHAKVFCMLMCCVWLDTVSCRDIILNAKNLHLMRVGFCRLEIFWRIIVWPWAAERVGSIIMSSMSTLFIYKPYTISILPFYTT